LGGLEGGSVGGWVGGQRRGWSSSGNNTCGRAMVVAIAWAGGLALVEAAHAGGSAVCVVRVPRSTLLDRATNLLRPKWAIVS
jgi:hypothetical protein